VVTSGLPRGSSRSRPSRIDCRKWQMLRGRWISYASSRARRRDRRAGRQDGGSRRAVRARRDAVEREPVGGSIASGTTVERDVEQGGDAREGSSGTAESRIGRRGGRESGGRVRDACPEGRDRGAPRFGRRGTGDSGRAAGTAALRTAVSCATHNADRLSDRRARNPGSMRVPEASHEPRHSDSWARLNGSGARRPPRGAQGPEIEPYRRIRRTTQLVVA
jgi:hypothetical protein